MHKLLRLTTFCFLFFAFQAKAQVQSSLENCAGYSVLSLSNRGTVAQSVNVPLNGKIEILTISPNETKLFKVKEEALQVDGQSIVAKTSNAALCFSSQLETQYYQTTKPPTNVTLGGGGNTLLSDPICGNGVKEGTEQCDDGNQEVCDTCLPSCVTRSAPSCGDGVTECSERCDDGNNSPGDGCSATCQFESTCGNGVKEGFEQCDDGNTNDCDSCHNGCGIQAIPVCGDFNISTTCGEICDDGNMFSNDGCSATCQSECGNGVVNAPLEECDGGANCSTACKLIVCGNARIDGTETCDDGNVVGNDGCSATCQTECGNSVVNAPLEECDTGNAQTQHQSCYQCKTQTCGNGRVDFIVGGSLGAKEECDDGNTNNNDVCLNNCTLQKDLVLTKVAYFDASQSYSITPLKNNWTVPAQSIVTFEVKLNFGGVPQVNSGELFSFTVKDALPSGFTYLYHSITGPNCNNMACNQFHFGSYNQTTGMWSMPASAMNTPLSYVTLKITGRATSTFTNCAQVTQYYRGDFDSTPNNLVGTNPIEDDEACVTLNVTTGCPTPTIFSDTFNTSPAAGTYQAVPGDPTRRYMPDTMTLVSTRSYTAYPNTPVDESEGLTYVTSSGGYIELQGNGFCVRGEASSSDPFTMSNMEYMACASVKMDPTVNSVFRMEDAEAMAYDFNTIDVPNIASTFSTYCIPVGGTATFLVTALSPDPLAVDNLCYYKQQAVCTTPTTTATVVQPTCANGFAQNNAQISLTGFNNQMRYDYNVGTSYTNGKTYNTATPVPVHGVIASGLPNATTSYTIRIWNADNCFITRTVNVGAVTCTTPCSLSATASNVACNNNSTTNTGTDDQITFSINPTKTGGTASTTYNLSVAGTTIAPTSGTYGSAATFALAAGSAGSGNKTVTITDANNASCSTTVNLTDPGTCSIPDCALNQPITSVTCDGKGTPDVSDDTYWYNITVTGSNTATTYGISGGDTQSGLAYGASQGAFGNFLISSGGRTLNITDATSGSCTTTASLTAPATCSPTQPTCSLSNPITSATCNDNGTPSNPADDTFSYNITVNGNNTGATYGITGGDTRSGLTYGTSQGAFGSFPISGGNLSLNIADVANAGCTTNTTVTAPASCSNQVACTMNDPVVVAYCNTNGTASAADDTFGYTISATGTGVSALYDVMGDDVRNDLAYVTENGPFGWYPLSQGALVLNVIDNVDTGCSNSAVVIAPDDCTFCTDPTGICVDTNPAGTCTITAPDITGVCNDNGTPSNPADDTFTYLVNVTHSGTDPTLLYNLSGGDSRSNLTYGFNQGPFGSFPISGGNLTLTATDADIPACTDGFTVTAPATCSSAVPQADLRVVKTASSTNVTSGQTITYTITVTNDGPDAATNVQLRDVLSSMLTYVSHTPSVGTYTLGTGIWAIPSLANGANATLMITVTVN